MSATTSMKMPPRARSTVRFLGGTCQARDGREYSRHAPGLGALLVLPFALGGPLAGRLLLCLLITPILGWACWRWLAGALRPATWRSLLSPAYCCARCAVRIGTGVQRPAGRVSSSCRLPSGCGTVTVDLDAQYRHRRLEQDRSSRGQSFASGRPSPWLHMKYLATTALFGLFAAWQIWRERQSREDRPLGPRWGHFAGGAALFLVGPARFSRIKWRPTASPLHGLGNQERILRTSGPRSSLSGGISISRTGCS